MRQRAVLPLFLVAKRTRKALHRKRLRQKARREEQRRKDSAARHTIHLVAPQYFQLAQQAKRNKVVEFLRSLVKLTLVERRNVCIDFRRTLRLHADGALLLYAELQRILQRRPSCLRCLIPKAPVPQQVLSHLGILKKLGYQKIIPSRRDDVTHWDVLSGTQADATLGLGEAIEKLPRLSRSQLGKLFRSVTEALTNVTQHAYTEPRMDGTGDDQDRGWWAFVRQEPESLIVTFCDLGLGVPYTVPRAPKHAGWLKQRMNSLLPDMTKLVHADGQTIQVTVDEKRSRFKAEHRGNGFGNMLETIDSAGRGTLNIFSNRGAYSYSLVSGKTTEGSGNYRESIYGTLVVWHIGLAKETP